MRTFRIQDKYFPTSLVDHPAEYTQIWTPCGKLDDVLVGADGEFLFSLKEAFYDVLVSLELGEEDE